MSINTYSASNINQYCPESSQISIITKPQELVVSICGTQSKYLQDPKIKMLTNSILSTLNIYAKNPSGWSEDIKLNEDIDTLNEQLERFNQLQLEKLNPKTKLQIALYNLNQKWSDKDKRNDPHLLNEYYNEVKNVISLTKTGKEVLECFNNAQGPLLSEKEEVIEMSPEEKASGAKMEFNLVHDKSNPGKYKKTVYFNSDIGPLDSIAILTHELKHGCNSKVHSELLSEIQSTTPESDAESKVLQKIEQENALDEMRAYKVTYESFSDLAQAAPQLMCHITSNSVLFGKQPLTIAEYSAKIEEMFKSGTFPHYLISFYAGHSIYNPQNVLELDDTGNFTGNLRSDLTKKLREEGVLVK